MVMQLAPAIKDKSSIIRLLSYLCEAFCCLVSALNTHSDSFVSSGKKLAKNCKIKQFPSGHYSCNIVGTSFMLTSVLKNYCYFFPNKMNTYDYVFARHTT